LPRDEFPVTERCVYLNHASVAPLPRAAAAATAEVAQAFADEGGLAFDGYRDRVEEVRSTAAQLIGATADDVAFVKNTTEGLGFVASGLDWQEGDRVVVPDREFPSAIYPWLALEEHGVRVDRIAPVGPGGNLPLDAFASALDEGPTRLVATSWVQFGLGWRTDIEGLARLCREHDALLCVDAIQGLGVVPGDLAAWGVDFAAADAHKLLLGPLGIGVFYVAPERRDDLRVLEVGWNSVSHREEWDNLELTLDPTARRFEGGTHNLVGLVALGASLDLLVAAGIDEVWRHVDALCDAAVGGLSDAGVLVLSDRSEDGRSSIVTANIPGVAPAEVCDRLQDDGIVCAPRGGGVRIAPHGYNTFEEIERLVEAMGALVPPPPEPEPEPEVEPEPKAPAPPPAQGPMRRPADW
jgi:selenocysteine lyase/cysteine desulfurase